MAPNIRSSKITLACPLFGADFDPRNDDFLLVGGGGGEGRSGVGNKIYLLDTSRPESLSQIVDIDLSPYEDSVSSLAVAHSCDQTLVAFAGINSSQEEQKTGNNEHLRSFKIDHLPEKTQVNGDGASSNNNKKKKRKKDGDKPKSDAKAAALSRVSLFTPEKTLPNKEKETYQRILRLSPWQGKGTRRVAAIATGFAPRGEIVLFNVDSSSPRLADVIERINVGELGDKVEAEDVDVTSTPAGYKFAYTDGDSLYTSAVSPMKVRNVYTAPRTKNKKHKIRAVRFLSQDFIVVLQNTVDRTGCELLLLQHKTPAEAVVIRRQKIPSSAKVGLGLDVCPLPESHTGAMQYVCAVSGGDHSISIYTLDFLGEKGFGKFKSYATLRDVHPFSMTRIVFSRFTPPANSDTSSSPQYIKLASVSVGNTAVVHTLPLAPSPTTKSKTPRYVLANEKSELWTTFFSSFMALVVVAIGAFLLQAFTEIRGGIPPTLGAVDWLSPRFRDMFARPYMLETTPTGSTSIIPDSSDIPTVRTTKSEPLRELLYLNMLREQSAMSAETTIKVIVENDGQGQISAKAIGGGGAEDSSSMPSTATKWEDLSAAQQTAWKAKLVEAGHLRDGDDEFFLHGVYFGDLSD